jgi:pilus assembly protein CpaE
MARLHGLILTDDLGFRNQIGRLLRSGPIPVAVIDDKSPAGTSPDIIVVDIRRNAASAMGVIERVRTDLPTTPIFAVALAADSSLILDSMRAGASEFLTWPPADEPFHAAVRRVAGRLVTAQQNAKPAGMAIVFFGAKGGAGTTTVAVNCGVEIARLTKKSTVIVDLKAGLGEVALFLGVRPRYGVLDAIDNPHRLDQEFLRQIISKHKSGLEILGGSEQLDRPNAADGKTIDEMFKLLARQYDYLVVDAGSQVTAFTLPILCTADQALIVANPDVPSVRNAQRLIERIRQISARGDHTHLLLNRAAEPYPIPANQIEEAVGLPIYHTFPSDYKTVSTALNSGVPLALAANSDLAGQFDQFTRKVVGPASKASTDSQGRRGLLGLDKIASLW